VPAVPPVTPTVAIDGPLPGSTINSSGTPAEISKARTHTVQKGDTLQSLSLKYYGTRSSWDKIYQVNRNVLASKDQLKIGQQLLIP
jgi:nucleoid-associated protein YgaU